LRRIDLRVAVARKYFAEIDQLGNMKMHDRIRVAVTRLLMNHVDGLRVDVEGQDFRERYTRAINSEFGETWRQRWRRTHYVAAYALERILVHGDEGPTSSPSSIALGMRYVLRGNHNVSNGRFGPTRKDAADERSACRRWRSDK